MKSDVVTLQDSVTLFGNNAKNLSALTALKNFFENPDNMENQAAVADNKTTIHDLHEFCEIADATIKNFKAMVECAANSIPALSTEFKWNKPRVSTTCTDMAQLHDLAVNLYDVDESCFAAKMKAITANDAADLFGLSEQALLEAHGDIFESKESKPSLKRVY